MFNKKNNFYPLIIMARIKYEILILNYKYQLRNIL
jgi:hypothetical protein